MSRRWSCTALAACLFAGGSDVVAQVRALTSLSRAAQQTIRDAVATALPDVQLEFVAHAEPGPPRDLTGIDALVGIDAAWMGGLRSALADLGREGIREPAGLVPFHRDREGRFVVPWADAYVVARSALAFGEGVAPRSVAAMGGEEFADRLVLPEPRLAPSLFVDWIRTPLRGGDGSNVVFARLVAVDARVRTWAVSFESVLAAVQAAPDETFGILPASFAFGSAGSIAFESLEPWSPLRGYAVAVVSTSRHRAAASRVVEATLAPALALELARLHGVLPGVSESAQAMLPAFVRPLVGASSPVDPEPERLEAWLDWLEAEVVGHGRYSESLGLALDLLFGGLFLLVIYWVHRRSMAADDT
jgi:hypothetical protein